jgi:hypothetical protein
LGWIQTHCIRSVNTFGLLAEGELLLAAKDFVDTFAVKDGNLWPVLL